MTTTITSVIKHPINPRMVRKGNDIDSFKEIVSIIKPLATHVRLEQIHVRDEGSPCPWISLTPGRTGPLMLGEVGLQYLVYRLGGDLDLPRKLYRDKDYVELSTLLTHMLRTAWASRRLDPARPVVVTAIDNELVGVMLNYAAMSNEMLVGNIALAKMTKLVQHWVWRPLECLICLDFALIFDKFHYGAAIRNGETGHRAMSFTSILWTEDELRVPGSEPIATIKQAWETVIPDYAYRRHTSADRVRKFTNSIKSSLKESEEVISLKRANSVPGRIVADIVFEKWSEIKARDSAKIKMEEAMKDLFKIASSGTALDVIEATIQASDILGTQAADNIAEQAVSIILAKVSDL